MTPFDQALRKEFPDAVPLDEFISTVRVTTSELGITPERTLALVGTCRDEEAAGLVAAIETKWGRSFRITSLGGVSFMGRSGWRAAFGHIPDATDRGALLVVCAPHIGISDAGEVGRMNRRGQDLTTPACGALSGLLAQVEAGALPAEVDPDDFEATRLALRVVDPAAPPASLVDLTTAAAEAAEAEVWAALDDVELWHRHDLLVYGAVQIHALDRIDRIWVRHATFQSADGVRRDLLAE